MVIIGIVDWGGLSLQQLQCFFAGSWKKYETAGSEARIKSKTFPKHINADNMGQNIELIGTRSAD